ncbi:hypothetical protein HHK36_000138 [Tetracentron sinense]|uniref:Protein kinase domain-containing protein n=1 Tax=Tetracentron sinense TaxID=13715 RepID=A0A834ZR44_TETSI|nr:hypothetical protein HHK36_000138 [Tetracentron sinense]
MVNKEKVLKVGLIEQIKREISVMRLVRHPNVVQLYEVMASKTRIYFVMEFAKGGELFNKIAKGKFKEDIERKYFQQLISSVDFYHSRGIYHWDLKPENLLLDENENLKVSNFGESENLKVSDFGLSALAESKRRDGLLETRVKIRKSEQYLLRQYGDLLDDLVKIKEPGEEERLTKMIDLVGLNGNESLVPSMLSVLLIENDARHATQVSNFSH